MATGNSGEVKSLIFDLMGTCLDWHTSISQMLKFQTPGSLAPDGPDRSKILEESSKLALAWREGFFHEIHARFEAGEEPEDIDDTHRRVLNRLIETPEYAQWRFLSEADREDCVEAWHRQRGR